MPTWQEKINARWLINMRDTLVDVDCLQNIRQIHKTEVVKASRAKWKFVDGFSSLVFLSIDHKISTQPYKHNKYLSWIRNKQTNKKNYIKQKMLRTNFEFYMRLLRFCFRFHIKYMEHLLIESEVCHVKCSFPTLCSFSQIRLKLITVCYSILFETFEKNTSAQGKLWFRLRIFCLIQKN